MYLQGITQIVLRKFLTYLKQKLYNKYRKVPSRRPGFENHNLNPKRGWVYDSVPEGWKTYNMEPHHFRLLYKQKRYTEWGS